MSELGNATSSDTITKTVMDNTSPSLANSHTEDRTILSADGSNTRQMLETPEKSLMADHQQQPSFAKQSLSKLNDAFGAFGKFMFNAFSFFMYMVGLFGFLCGAAVPVITLWFFLNVDVVIRWWHILLGIGGNIGIFIVSMSMIRDLYVQPLIEKIEAAQARAEWGEPPARS